MSRKFLPPMCQFDIQDGVIVTDGSIRRKITGTAFGAVLGHNPWQSPFEASCRLLGLIEEDGVGDKPAVITGQVLEVPIIRYLDATYEGKFLPDEELNICAPREGPHDSWKSDWEDPVFGGHIDGAVISLAEETYILEIKTAKDLTAWEQGVPQHYQDQVRLYNWFLTQQEWAFVGLGVVTDETYKDSESWVPNEDNVALYHLNIDLEQTAKDIDYCRTWYETYIEQGRTMMYNPNNPRDVEIMDYLMSVNMPQDEMMESIDRLAVLEGEIEEYDKAIDDKRKEAEALRKSIKDHMTTNQVDSMESASHDYIVTIRHQERKSIDEKAMKEAGLDPEDFRKTTISNVFSIKKRK